MGCCGSKKTKESEKKAGADEGGGTVPQPGSATNTAPAAPAPPQADHSRSQCAPSTDRTAEMLRNDHQQHSDQPQQQYEGARFAESTEQSPEGAAASPPPRRDAFSERTDGPALELRNTPCVPHPNPNAPPISSNGRSAPRGSAVATSRGSSRVARSSHRDSASVTPRGLLSATAQSKGRSFSRVRGTCHWSRIVQYLEHHTARWQAHRRTATFRDVTARFVVEWELPTHEAMAGGCPVCGLPFELGQMAIVLRCQHVLHWPCAEPHRFASPPEPAVSECPICHLPIFLTAERSPSPAARCA